MNSRRLGDSPEEIRPCQIHNLITAKAEASPLTDKTRALVKLAIAVGGQMEGAVHSHTRRALEAGCSPEEIYHVALLGTTTLGFPTKMKTFSWVDDVQAQKAQFPLATGRASPLPRRQAETKPAKPA